MTPLDPGHPVRFAVSSLSFLTFQVTSLFLRYWLFLIIDLLYCDVPPSTLSFSGLSRSFPGGVGFLTLLIRLVPPLLRLQGPRSSSLA